MTTHLNRTTHKQPPPPINALDAGEQATRDFLRVSRLIFLTDSSTARLRGRLELLYEADRRYPGADGIWPAIADEHDAIVAELDRRGG